MIDYTNAQEMIAARVLKKGTDKEFEIVHDMTRGIAITLMETEAEAMRKKLGMEQMLLPKESFEAKFNTMVRSQLEDISFGEIHLKKSNNGTPIKVNVRQELYKLYKQANKGSERIEILDRIMRLDEIEFAAVKAGAEAVNIEASSAEIHSRMRRGNP